MRLEHQINTHPRLLRRASIREQGESVPKSRNASGKTNGSRFVDPAHLDEEKKARICRALEKRRIGDEMGRQIFVGALEYQLSAFGHQLEKGSAEQAQPRPRNVTPEKGYQPILETARLLSGLIRDLPDASIASLAETLAAQDELHRGYDERYLCELGCEIDRLERACIAAAPPAEPEAPQDNTTPSREFVTKLAEVFVDCFETKPTADEEGQFRGTLDVLSEVTDLVIGRDPQFLAAALPGG